MPIQSIKARQIYDSRGNPTVEVFEKILEKYICNIYIFFEYSFNNIIYALL